MSRFIKFSVRLRGLSSRFGSLILLFQRSPLVQMLFPEARILGGAGLGEVTLWTVATVAGLGAYDTVAGATVVAQVSPVLNSVSVPAASGSSMVFLFQCTGAPGAPGSWTVTGTLPAGLVHANAKSSSTDSITGTPTQTGSFPITVKAWRYTNYSGESYSKNFTLVVDTAIITTQPVSDLIKSGTTKTLSVVGALGTGSSLSYQWYRGASPVTTTPISGATLASYTTPALTASTNYWVRVTRKGVVSTPVANTAYTVFANSSTATIGMAVAPSITANPSALTINSGATATLSVTASGTAPLTYQWYQGASGVTTSPLLNATSASFTSPALTTSTSYWVRVTNISSSVNSSAAAVTVNQPATITSNPSAVTINSGATATLSVTASGTAPLTYQWYQGASGVTTSPLLNATSASFTSPALTTGTSYWVRVTNPSGSVNSSAAAVTISQPVSITSNPSGVTINSGATATLSVTASGTAPLTYQWYQGASGVTTSPLLNATSASFTSPALTTSTSYWVRVTNPSGSVNSSAAMVTVIDTFASWQGTYFNGIQLANPLVSGTAADPDGDGISNEKEYIFGLSPLTAGPSPSPVASLLNDRFVIDFLAKAAGGSGYAGKTRYYTIETSDTIGAGSWTELVGYTNILGTGQEVHYTIPVGGPRKFYRLRVWLLP
jgi:hypothetical protein